MPNLGDKRGRARPASEAMGRALAALTASLALVAAGCGSSHHAATEPRATSRTGSTTTYPQPPITPPPSTGASTGTTTPTSTTPTTRPRIPPTTIAAPPPPPSEQAALTRLLATYPARSFAVSPFLRTGNISYVAVARNVNLTSVVDIDVYQGGQFVPSIINIGAGENLDPVDSTNAVQTADITGAPFPDFLVLLAAGDHDNGVLVSYAGGTWHLVGTAERTGPAASPELVQPRIIGNEVTQAVNDCAPNCARGSYSVTTYQFAPGLDALAANGPTIQSPTP